MRTICPPLWQEPDLPEAKQATRCRGNIGGLSKLAYSERAGNAMPSERWVTLLQID